MIRRHFTPDEVRPTAKQISKAYGLMDMVGAWLERAGGAACWGPDGGAGACSHTLRLHCRRATTCGP